MESPCGPLRMWGKQSTREGWGVKFTDTDASKSQEQQECPHSEMLEQIHTGLDHTAHDWRTLVGLKVLSGSGATQRLPGGSKPGVLEDRKGGPALLTHLASPFTSKVAAEAVEAIQGSRTTVPFVSFTWWRQAHLHGNSAA